MSKIKLGINAKDKITGFEGSVTGHAKYITGCDQFLLQPKCEDGKSGTKPEGQWFDDGRLEAVSKGITSKDVESSTGTGADMQAPSK